MQSLASSAFSARCRREVAMVSAARGRQTRQESIVHCSTAAGQAWWGHVIQCVGLPGRRAAFMAPQPLLVRADVCGVWRKIRWPSWKHPASTWRCLVDSCLFDVYDSACLTLPHDRGGWAESRPLFVGWVVGAVRGPAIVAPALWPQASRGQRAGASWSAWLRLTAMAPGRALRRMAERRGTQSSSQKYRSSHAACASMQHAHDDRMHAAASPSQFSRRAL